MEKERPPTIEELESTIAQKDLEIEFLERQNVELKRYEELATKDLVTGLYNRRGFSEMIQKIAPEVPIEEDRKERRKQRNAPISILVLDLDNFKEINDLYGHETGDIALRRLADFLLKETRAHDVVARLGGDEFVLAMNGADAQEVVNKFYHKELGRAAVNFALGLKGETVTCTVSGGVTDLRPGENLEEAMKRADDALYASKDAGRDRITNWNNLEKKENGK